MGIMMCDKHGRVGFVEVCSHVAKDLKGGFVPNGYRLTIMGSLFVCDDCFKSLGFAQFASLEAVPLEQAIAIRDGRWEAFEVAYRSLPGRQAFCGECFRELEGGDPSNEK